MSSFANQILRFFIKLVLGKGLYVSLLLSSTLNLLFGTLSNRVLIFSPRTKEFCLCLMLLPPRT